MLHNFDHTNLTVSIVELVSELCNIVFDRNLYCQYSDRPDV